MTNAVRIVAIAGNKLTEDTVVPLPQDILYGSQSDLTWSPSGTSFALTVALTPTVERRVLAFDSAIGKLLDVGPGDEPVWSPDANTVVAQVVNDDLVSINMQTHDVRKLTGRKDWSWGNPVFLPGQNDSVLVAGMSFDDSGPRGQGPYSFWLIPTDGSQRITETKPDISGWGRVPANVSISPDGKWLLYTWQDPFDCCNLQTGHTLVSVEKGTSVSFQPTPESVPTQYVGQIAIHTGWSFGWLPDSQRFAVSRFFTYGESGFSSQPDFDSCTLDILDLQGTLRLSIPLCVEEVSFNAAINLMAVQVAEGDGFHVKILDQNGSVLHDLGKGTSPVFAP